MVYPRWLRPGGVGGRKDKISATPYGSFIYRACQYIHRCYGHAGSVGWEYHFEVARTKN